MLMCVTIFNFSFYILFIYFYREGAGGRKRGRETSIVVASHVPPAGDLGYNPAMCPDRESNTATLWFAGQHSIH